MRFGICLGASACVLDQTLSPSNAKPGTSIGVEPTATTMFLASSVFLPSLLVTSTLSLATNLASPMCTSTLWFLSRPPTPDVSLLTMPAFHATRAPTSRPSNLALMPIRSACWILSTSLLAAISALLGMQPTLRHTPPRFSFSTMAVLRPSWAQRIAQT